jgi:hypothetical protein
MSDLESTSDKSVNGTSLDGMVEGLGQISLMARKAYIKQHILYSRVRVSIYYVGEWNLWPWTDESRGSKYISLNTYFISVLDLESTSDISLFGSSLYDLVERFDDFEARMAVTEGGN